MKRKKLLSLLLSAIMLVGSVPAMVLADNEDPNGDPEMADTDGDDEGEDPDDMDDEMGEGEDDPIIGGDPVIETIPESNVFVVGQMEPYDCLTYYFAPSTTGRYGVLCADGRDLKVSVADNDGYVSPMESARDFRYDVQYLNLQAGETYEIFINSDSYATLSDKDVYCYICPMQDTIPYGESALFVKSGDGTKRHTFIPEQSGQHIFEFSTDYNMTASIKDGNKEVPYTGSGNTIVADLVAGKAYDITIDVYRRTESWSYNVVGVNVSMNVPVLHTGENEVQLKANSEDSFFVFTPETDGVYIYESKGEYDTQGGTRVEYGYDYGDGSNFRTAMYMKGGVTYYLRASQNGPDSVTVLIYITPASVIQPGQTYSFEAMSNDKYYFTMTPAQSGWYYLDAGNSNRYINVLDTQNYYKSVYDDAWYMEAGQTYYMMYQYYGDDHDTVEFSYEKIAASANLDAPFTVSQYSPYRHNYYTVYTPEVSGMYTFTSDHATSHFDVYDRSGSDKVMSESVSGSLEKSVYLFSGMTYLIYFTDSSDPQTPYVATMQKQENAVSLDVNYEIDFPSNVKKQYSFTPETSGYYMFSYYGNLSGVYVYDGTTCLYGSTFSQDNYCARIVKLEGGKNYKIQVSHYLSNTDGMYWYAHKVESLETGTNIPVNVTSGYGFYTFTPSESGAYTFSSEMLQNAMGSSYIMLKDEERNFLQLYLSLSDSQLKDQFSLVLEEGQTYFMTVKMKTSATASYTMDIVKEQALVVGDNMVTITDRNSAHIDELNGICSFIPEEDGLYAFTSHSQTADPHITVYDSTMFKIGEDSSSGEKWNFYLELYLEGGKQYYINIDEYEGMDLPVEVKKIELMEAKLDGYSLSLDGTIEVNLYMTLNELVVKSNTAVLQYTRADGTVVSLGMNKAEKRVLKGKTYYVFHLPVAAKEMTAQLKAQIVDPGNDFEGNKYTFTVRDYAQYIIDQANEGNQEYADALPLVCALLNYGTAAQNYFGFNVSDLANKNLYAFQKSLGSVPTSRLPAYEATTEVLPEGVIFEGASLSTESETELVFYFSNPNGLKLSFSDSTGKTFTPGQKGNYTTIRVKGIPAQKLGENITLKISVEGDANDYQVVYNPMTYCYNVLTRPLTETRTKELKDLMKAFYFYNQAAVSYLAED